MKNPIFLLLIIALTGSVLCYEVLETEHVKVFYDSKYESIASYVARIAENYWTYITDLIGYNPESKVNILLVDSGVLANGAYMGFNNVVIYLTPPRTPILNLRSWYEMVVVHELTHFVHSEYETGFPAILDSILTGTRVFSSQFRSPFVESTTLFAESHISPYQGRLNNPITNMGLYAAAIKGRWFPNLISASAAPEDEFLGRGIYYYIPSGFHDYLSKRFGHQKVKDFLKEFSGCFMGLGINVASSKAFGKSLDALYAEWMKELAENARKYNNQGEEIFTHKRLYVSDFQVDRNKIYLLCSEYTNMGATFGFRKRYIRIIDLNGEKGQTILAPYADSPITVENGTIYFSILEAENPGSEKILRIIKSLKTSDNNEKELARGVISAFDVYKGRLFYAVYDPAKMESKIMTPEKQITNVKGFVREMDVGDEGMVLLVSREGNGNEMVLIQNGKQEYLLTDPFFKSSVNWYRKKIIFCAAYENGYMNIYSLDPSTGEARKLTDKSVFWIARPHGEHIYALGYSQHEPATAIYKLKSLDLPFNIPKHESAELNLKPVDIEKKDGNIEYLADLIVPDMRFPIVDSIQNGTSTRIGIGYSTLHFSVDYKTALMLAPIFYTTDIKSFTLGGMALLSLQPFDNLQIYSSIKTIDFSSFSDYYMSVYLYIDILRKKLSRNRSINLAAFLNWTPTTGSFSPGITVGYSTDFYDIPGNIEFSTWWDNSIEASLQLSTLLNDHALFTAKMNGNVSTITMENLQLELSFPLANLKFGILDPYFYVNNAYLALDTGIDENQTFWLGGWIGVQAESFIFPRVSPIYKLKVRWTLGTGEITFSFGI